MDDERSDGGGDDLVPPYRPWQGSGVPQPGADRPVSAAPPPDDPSRRRGQTPPPPVLPEYPLTGAPADPQWYAPVDQASAGAPPRAGTVLPVARPASARPAPPSPARTGAGRRLLVAGVALLAGATSWLPWFKTYAAGMVTMSGSGPRQALSAWDIPVRFIWSYLTPRGGPSLGWFVLGAALAIVALVLVADGGARTISRLLAAAEGVMAIMFLVQIARIVDRTPTFGVVDVGVTDFAGIGVYSALVLSFVLLILPRD